MLEYASKMGINVPKENHLLYLAREALNTKLPEYWKPWYDSRLCPRPHTVCVQHVGGARGVVLLQHGDRRQPVGAPGGLLVQAGHLPQQAQGQHPASRSERYQQTLVHCKMRRVRTVLREM